MYKNIGLLLGLYTVGSIFAADPLADGPPVKRRCTGEGIFASEAPVVSMPVELSKQEKEIVARRLDKHSAVFQAHYQENRNDAVFMDMSAAEKNVHVYSQVMEYPLNEEEEVDNQCELNQEERRHLLQDFEDRWARYMSINRGLASIQQILLAVEGDDQESIVDSCKSYIKNVLYEDKEKAIIGLLRAADYLGIRCMSDVSAQHAALHYRDLFSHGLPYVESRISENGIDPKLQQLIIRHLFDLLEKERDTVARRLKAHSTTFQQCASSCPTESDRDIYNAVMAYQFDKGGDSEASDNQCELTQEEPRDSVQDVEDRWARHTSMNRGLASIQQILLEAEGDGERSIVESCKSYMKNVQNIDKEKSIIGLLKAANYLGIGCILDVSVSCAAAGYRSLFLHDPKYVERSINESSIDHDLQQLIIAQLLKEHERWLSQQQCIRLWQGHTRLGSDLFYLQQQCNPAFKKYFHNYSTCDHIWNNCTRKKGYGAWQRGNSVYSVRFNSNGSQLVSGSHDGTVRIWNAQTGDQVKEWKAHKSSVNSVAFNHDGSRVVSGSSDGAVHIWNAQTGECLYRCKKHTRMVWSVAFNHDGSQVVSGSNDATVRISDAHTGKKVKEWKVQSGGVHSVAFNHDGSRLVAGYNDGTVRIWNAHTRDQVKEWKAHSGYVRSIAFNPDGSQVVSGSNDGKVRIWNAHTGGLQHSADSDFSCIDLVGFSPDGLEVVLASHGRVFTWDLANYADNVQSLDLPQALYVYCQLKLRGSRLCLPNHPYLHELHNSLPDNIKRILEY